MNPVNPPALLLCADKVKSDPAFAVGGRGARKVVVTQLFEPKETPATEVVWDPAAQAKCPVHVAKSFEFAIFTEKTPQDKHFHRQGTEIYTVLQGKMVIEVEGVEYTPGGGETIIVHPPSVHLVKAKEGCEPFMCQVVCTDCGGTADKFVVQ